MSAGRLVVIDSWSPGKTDGLQRSCFLQVPAEIQKDSIPLAIDESAECQCWRTSIAVIPMKGLVSWGRR